jgi:hypothetical protein
MNKLESLLRAHEDQLCAVTTARFQANLPAVDGTTLTLAEIRAGAKYTHDLILVAVALYPSDITLRNEWSWASSGMLPRHGIGYEHFVTMLRAYFSSAADILADESKDRSLLDTLEAFIKKSLEAVFKGPR